MSHFNVLVAADDVDAAMSPFKDYLEDSDERNPLGRWEWYSIGGRWDQKWIKTTDGETVNQTTKAKLSDETKPTWAVVVNGQWYEKGRMLMFGEAADEGNAETWDEQWAAIIAQIPDDTTLTLVDCHQ